MHRTPMVLLLAALAACGKSRDEAPTQASPAQAAASAPAVRAAPAPKPAPADAAPAPDRDAPNGPVRASALTIEIVDGMTEEGGTGVAVSLEAELLEDTVRSLPRLELAIACRVGASVVRESVAVILPPRGQRRRVSHTFWQDQPLEEPPTACEARAAFAEGNAQGRIGQPVPLGVACLDGETLADRPCTADLAASFGGD